MDTTWSTNGQCNAECCIQFKVLTKCYTVAMCNMLINCCTVACSCLVLHHRNTMFSICCMHQRFHVLPHVNIVFMKCCTFAAQRQRAAPLQHDGNVLHQSNAVLSAWPHIQKCCTLANMHTSLHLDNILATHCTTATIRQPVAAHQVHSLRTYAIQHFISASKLSELSHKLHIFTVMLLSFSLLWLVHCVVPLHVLPFLLAAPHLNCIHSCQMQPVRCSAVQRRPFTSSHRHEQPAGTAWELMNAQLPQNHWMCADQQSRVATIAGSAQELHECA
jgi:hypothetical protein